MFNSQIAEYLKIDDSYDVLVDKSTLFSHVLLEKISKMYNGEKSPAIGIWEILKKHIPAINEDFQNSKYSKRSDYLYFMTVEMYEDFYAKNSNITFNINSKITKEQRAFVKAIDEENKRESKLFKEIIEKSNWNEISINSYLDFIFCEKIVSKIGNKIIGLGVDLNMKKFTSTKNFRNWNVDKPGAYEGQKNKSEQLFDLFSALQYKFKCFFKHQKADMLVSKMIRDRHSTQSLEEAITKISNLRYDISNYEDVTKIYVRNLEDVSRLFLIVNAQPHYEYNNLLQTLMENLVSSEQIKNEILKEKKALIEKINKSIDNKEEVIKLLRKAVFGSFEKEKEYAQNKKNAIERFYQNMIEIFGEIKQTLLNIKDEAFYESIKNKLLGFEQYDLDSLENSTIIIDEFYTIIGEYKSQVLGEIKKLTKESKKSALGLKSDKKILENIFGRIISEKIIDKNIHENMKSIDKLMEQPNGQRQRKEATPVLSQKIEKFFFVDLEENAKSKLIDFVHSNPFYFTSAKKRTTLKMVLNNLSNYEYKQYKETNSGEELLIRYKEEETDFVSKYNPIFESSAKNNPRIAKLIKALRLVGTGEKLTSAKTLSNISEPALKNMFKIARNMCIIDYCEILDDPLEEEINSYLELLGLVPLYTKEDAIKIAPLDWYISKAIELSMDLKIEREVVKEVAALYEIEMQDETNTILPSIR
ncbi:MAG: hypothetical protein II980_06095 [Clostridia bacterium]|nr:hypothetical protein [Clostridia bacterium]